MLLEIVQKFCHCHVFVFTDEAWTSVPSQESADREYEKGYYGERLEDLDCFVREEWEANETQDQLYIHH